MNVYGGLGKVSGEQIVAPEGKVGNVGWIQTLKGLRRENVNQKTMRRRWIFLKRVVIRSELSLKKLFILS